MRGQNGNTYLEVMIVTINLGIVAAVAMPDLSSTDSKKLDVVAKQIADAIVLAKADAIRKKIPHGIYTDTVNDRIRVYSLPAETAVYNVYHPIDKRIYDIQLKTDPQSRGVDLVSANFSYDNSLNSSTYLDFNTDGTPKLTGGIPYRDHMLTSGSIIIAYNQQRRQILIEPMTGRVTVIAQ